MKFLDHGFCLYIAFLDHDVLTGDVIKQNDLSVSNTQNTCTHFKI